MTDMAREHRGKGIGDPQCLLLSGNAACMAIALDHVRISYAWFGGSTGFISTTPHGFLQLPNNRHTLRKTPVVYNIASKVTNTPPITLNFQFATVISRIFVWLESRRKSSAFLSTLFAFTGETGTSTNSLSPRSTRKDSDSLRCTWRSPPLRLRTISPCRNRSSTSFTSSTIEVRYGRTKNAFWRATARTFPFSRVNVVVEIGAIAVQNAGMAKQQRKPTTCTKNPPPVLLAVRLCRLFASSRA